MVKINRPFVGIFAIFIALLTCWGCWFSLSGYMAFLKSSDIIIFSWKVGMFLFGAPLLFYFSFLAFYCIVKNKIPVMNNKLANYLAVIFLIGAVISLFSSIYISNNLRGNGYVVCPKGSWMDPNKYAKEISLCLL